MSYWVSVPSLSYTQSTELERSVLCPGSKGGRGFKWSPERHAVPRRYRRKLPKPRPVSAAHDNSKHWGGLPVTCELRQVYLCELTCSTNSGPTKARLFELTRSHKYSYTESKSAQALNFYFQIRTWWWEAAPTETQILLSLQPWDT